MNLWDNDDGKTCLDLDRKRKQTLSLIERCLCILQNGYLYSNKRPISKRQYTQKLMIAMKHFLPVLSAF